MNYTSNMGMNMPDENDKFSIEHFNTNTQTLDIVGKPDEYKNTKTYAVGDLCIHNNILYKCITAVETAEEFNAEKWEVTSLCKEEVANKTAIAELNEKMDADKIIIGTFLINFNSGIGYLPYNHYPEYEKEPICIAMMVGKQRYGMTVVPSNYKEGRIELYTDAAVNGNLYVSYFIGLRK